MKLRKRASSPRYTKILIPTGIVLLLFAGFFGVLKFNDVFSGGSSDDQLSNKAPEQNEEKPTGQQSNPDQQDKEQATTEAQNSASNSQPAAISETGNDWWVVNKTRPLNPKEYQPTDLVFPNVNLRVPGNESMKLRAEPATATEQLFAAAKTIGYNPMFSSGFRSYDYQVNLYGGYVKTMGQTEADKQSARPGYSEHQTGLAFDVCNANNCKLEQEFASTPFGQWVKDNAHKYGFTIRYKEGKQDITGYIYEPWHLRYVGTDLATKLYSSNQTMEEYFGLPPAPDYK